MPLVRIDVPHSLPAARRAVVGDIVHAAMSRTLDVPDHDRFQVIAAHAAADLVVDPTYLDIDRSKNAILIQVTLNEGRATERKITFYAAVADDLQKEIGLRREDVVINLIETTKENWSFGNGEAQYA